MSAYSTRGHEEYYTDSDEADREILSRMKEVYNESATINQTFWNTASIDSRFYAGDQSVWNEVYSHLPSFTRKQFNFNKIRRIVNMITGYQRRNRKSVVSIPQEDADQQVADQLSKLLLWANNGSNMLYTLSEAFEGSLVTGMNLLSFWMDYRKDPVSGDIRVDNMSYNGYLIDPFFKKQDLSDCNYIWTRKFLSKKQIISLMPERKGEIEAMNPRNAQNGRFNFLPQNYDFASKDLLAYDEFWYLDYRDSQVLVDDETGETFEWNGDEENLKLFLSRYPQVNTRKIQVPTTQLAVVVNTNKTFYHGKNPMNIDKYPFVPVLAYYDPDLPYYEWRVQGVVRGLRDAQYLYNRRRQIELDILESQINSGMKVMEDSLIDDRDAFKSGQGQPLFIKKNAPMGMDSVQPFVPPQIPPSMLQLSEQLAQDITEISGVNEELLGSADDDKAGILSMLRQGAGLTTLQTLFDQLDLSLKLAGQLEVDLIQNNFSIGKMRRILNEEPSEQFKNKAFQKFDIQVVEGTDSATQKQQGFQQALYLKEVGLPIPDEFLIEMSTLQNKDKLKEQMEAQAKQAQEMQQQQMQLQMAQLEAQTKLANARAEADEGLRHERDSRVLSNIGLMQERRMESVKDLEQATLDKIKSIKELQGINLEHVEKALSIIQSLKQQEEQIANPQEAQTQEETV